MAAPEARLSLSKIARALDRVPGVIHNVIASSSGVAPAARTRSPRSLSTAEREAIYRGLAAGESLRSISSWLGRCASTISREVTRNGGRAHYRAGQADARAWEKATRPKPCLLAQRRDLRDLVAQKLSDDWSPEQISGWLKEQYPNDHTMRVSHETIYLSRLVLTRGVLKKELKKHLRSHRTTRRAQGTCRKGQGRGSIQDPVSIRERPAHMEDRAIPGAWEGDLIAGSKNTHVVTLVERRSRFTLLIKVDGKDAPTVTAALTRHIHTLPTELRTSLAWDHGSELSQHKHIALATTLPVYFRDPQAPWQRGTNENTDGLLRQYMPKGPDLSLHNQADLDAFANKLNARPRKTLGFKTPAATLQASVATPPCMHRCFFSGTRSPSAACGSHLPSQPGTNATLDLTSSLAHGSLPSTDSPSYPACTR